MEILLVEPSAGEVIIIQDALDKLNLDYSLTVVKNGVECLDLIKRAETSGEIRMPDLIIIESWLPGILNGLELVQALKLKECRPHTAIFLLTSFNNDNGDVKWPLEMRIDGCFTKPDLEKYGDILREIIEIARKKMNLKS